VLGGVAAPRAAELGHYESVAPVLRGVARLSRRVHLRLGVSQIEDSRKVPDRLGFIGGSFYQTTWELGTEIELNPRDRARVIVVGSVPVVHGRASDAEEWEVVHETVVGLRAGVGTRIRLGARTELHPEVSMTWHDRVDAPFVPSGRAVRKDVEDLEVSLAFAWVLGRQRAVHPIE
jgi:hypothetical protein